VNDVEGSVGASNASEGLNVLVTGGSGASGIAVAGALKRAGHRVFTVGSDRAHIESAAARAGDGVTPLVCDLSDLSAVHVLRETLTGIGGRMDAVIHLVGGWRGAQGIADQSDEDWDFLERGAITTLRNVSRVFVGDLAASGTGRFAMVSSTANRQVRHGLLHGGGQTDGGGGQLRGGQSRRRNLDHGHGGRLQP
jgi:NADP-dependent 3-hydroxy acid dehydrogenase YdfG